MQAAGTDTQFTPTLECRAALHGGQGPATRRLLFVAADGAPLAADLDALDAGWSAAAAASAETALRYLDEVGADALVIGDGTPACVAERLVAEVESRYPEVARLSLSAAAETAPGAYAMDDFHRTIGGPIAPEELLELVSQTLSIHRMVSDPKVRAAAGELEHLPGRPETYTAVERMLADPYMSLSKVAARIAEDVAIASELIKVVNTPFFYRGQRIKTVLAAVQRLGPARVRDLVLTLELRRMPATECAGYSMAAASNHGLTVATLAKRLARGIVDEEVAFLAGLVHDIGETVAAIQLPRRFQVALAARRTRRLPDATVERAHLGATHGQLGALLLALWGFDCDIIDAVAHHHEPWLSARTTVGLTDILCACELLVEGIEEDSAPHREALAYLRDRGLYDDLMGPWSRIWQAQGNVGAVV